MLMAFLLPLPCNFVIQTQKYPSFIPDGPSSASKELTLYFTGVVVTIKKQAAWPLEKMVEWQRPKPSHTPCAGGDMWT